MKVGFLDTSCLVAVAFGEPGAKKLAKRLAGYDELVASNLLEAEFRAVLRREGVEGGEALLEGITWLLPDRPLSAEMDRVLAQRGLRHADLWHLALALYLADPPGEMDFLTLDVAQREAAAALGFSTPV